MTTVKSCATTLLVLAISAAILSGCGGKKARAEKAANKQAAPVEDITYPPTILKPEQDEGR